MTRVPFPSLSGLRPMLLPASLLTALMAVLLAAPAMGAVPPASAAGAAAIVQAPEPRLPPPPGRGVLAPSGFGRPLRRLPVPASRRPPGIPAGPGAGLQGPRHRIHRVVRRWRPRHHGNRLRHDDPRRHLPLEDPAGMDRRGRRMDGRTPRKPPATPSPPPPAIPNKDLIL